MKLYETYFMLREYEESSYFALCSQIECPIRRTKCLRVARILCRNNKVCQQAIDRELDAIAMKHGFPNEDPGNFYPGGLSEGEILNEGKTFKGLIFTWKKTGTPAQAMIPYYKKIKSKYGNYISFKTYYYENQPEKFKEFGIKAVPTLLIIDTKGKRYEFRGVLGDFEKEMKKEGLKL
jgi:hypothetical protein